MAAPRGAVLVALGLADLTAITKYDPAGRPVWTKALEGRPGELAVTPAGELFAVAGDALVKLAPVAP